MSFYLNIMMSATNKPKQHQQRQQHDNASPTNFAWKSLLELLSPSEYFVSINYSVLWYHHVAWAKPKGEGRRLEGQCHATILFKHGGSLPHAGGVD